MDPATHRLQDLFRQLGLPDDRQAIEHFITSHRPLPAGVALSDAGFWSVSQAQFLREAIAADADWAELVDMLSVQLSAAAAPALVGDAALPTLLVLAGSARAGSLNRRLARCVVAKGHGAGLLAHEFDPGLLRMPVYDGDLEATSGVPDGAHQLLAAIAACDGLLLVTPEYNGFPTPLLINALDWRSRIPAGPPGPAGLAVTANRPVALLSASPGPGGALRSMNTLRQYLQMAFQMVVAPQQFALGKAHEAFDAAGALQDARSSQAVDGVLRGLAGLVSALRTQRIAQ